MNKSDTPCLTKNLRPWWWWVNPWLYIKRRDIAYDVALHTIYELNMDIEARTVRT